MVRIDYGGGAAGEGGLGGGSGGGGPNTPKSKVTTFGQKQAPCGLNFTASEANLQSYVGDVVVRKVCGSTIASIVVMLCGTARAVTC